MIQVSHYWSVQSMPWIFALWAVTACSSSESPSTTTGPEGTVALTCPGEPAPAQDSFLPERPSTGFAILRSHSKRNSTSPDGPRCWQAKEIPSK